MPSVYRTAKGFDPPQEAGPVLTDEQVRALRGDIEEHKRAQLAKTQPAKPAATPWDGLGQIAGNIGQAWEQLPEDIRQVGIGSALIPLNPVLGLGVAASAATERYSKENPLPEQFVQRVPGLAQAFPIDTNRPTTPTLIPGQEQWQQRGEPFPMAKGILEGVLDPTNLIGAGLERLGGRILRRGATEATQPIERVATRALTDPRFQMPGAWPRTVTEAGEPVSRMGPAGLGLPGNAIGTPALPEGRFNPTYAMPEEWPRSPVAPPEMSYPPLARQTELPTIPNRPALRSGLEGRGYAMPEGEPYSANLALRGNRERVVPQEMQAARSPVVREPVAGVSPWKMSSREFHIQQNTPKVEAIQQVIRDGKQIVVTTHTRATRLTSPDHIRIAPNGEAQIPSGRQWVNLTDELLDNTASQAGIKPKPYSERIYHRAEVRDAIASGKPVPPEVLSEYPDLVAADMPIAQPAGVLPWEVGKNARAAEEAAYNAEVMLDMAQQDVLRFDYKHLEPLNKILGSRLAREREALTQAQVDALKRNGLLSGTIGSGALQHPGQPYHAVANPYSLPALADQIVEALGLDRRTAYEAMGNEWGFLQKYLDDAFKARRSLQVAKEEMTRTRKLESLSNKKALAPTVREPTLQELGQRAQTLADDNARLEQEFNDATLAGDDIRMQELDARWNALQTDIADVQKQIEAKVPKAPAVAPKPERVSQQSFTPSGQVRENIQYGEPPKGQGELFGTPEGLRIMDRAGLSVESTPLFGQAGGAAPGAAVALTPQQPDESDEDYRKRLALGVAGMAAGMALGRVRRVGSSVAFGPKVNKAIASAIDVRGDEAMWAKAVQEARAVVVRNARPDILNKAHSIITPAANRMPEVQQPALAAARYGKAQKVASEQRVRTVEAMIKDAFTSQEMKAGRSRTLQYTGPRTPGMDKVAGTIWHYLDDPTQYANATPKQQELARVWGTITDAERDFSVSKGVSIGEVEGNWIAHRLKNMKKNAQPYSPGPATIGKPGFAKGRTLDTPDWVAWAVRNGEIETDVLKILRNRLDGTARMRTNQVFLDAAAANTGGKQAGIANIPYGYSPFTSAGKTWIFPDEQIGSKAAQDVAAVFKPMQKGTSESVAEGVSDFARALLLNLDFSVALMRQGWQGFTSDPRAAAGAFKEIAGAITSKQGRLEWLTANQNRMQKAVQHGLTIDAGSIDMTPAGAGETRHVIDKIPGLAQMNELQAFVTMIQKLNNYETTFNTLQAARDGKGVHKLIQGIPVFGAALERSGGKLAGMSDDELRNVAADAMNNWIGGQEWAKVGKAPGAGFKLMFLTPSWMRGQLNMISNVPRLSPEGMIARKLLAQQIGAVAAVGTVASLALTGNLPEYDPRSVHWLDIKTKDGYITIFPYKTTLRAVARAIGGIPKGEYGSDTPPLEQRLEGLQGYFGSRMAQLPRMAFDINRGRDYFNQPIENAPAYVGQQMMPIIAQQVTEDIGNKKTPEQIAGRAAGEFVGASVYSNSPSGVRRTALDTIAQQRTGKKWDDIGPWAQDVLRKEPAIQQADAAVKAAQKPQYQIDVTASTKVGQDIENGLPTNIRGEMQAAGEHIGPLARTIETDYRLTDEQYQEYQGLVSKWATEYGNKLITGFSYQKYTPKVKASVWNEKIKLAREKARDTLIANHRKEWMAEYNKAKVKR